MQDCSVQASLTEYMNNYITNDDGQITPWGCVATQRETYTLCCRIEYKAHALVNNTG